MPFQLRSNTNSTKIMIGTEDYIEVRPELTKKEFRAVIRSLPENIAEEGARMTYDQSEGFLGAVFEKMITGWSVVDSDGNSVPPTLENLEELPRSAATAIEQALMQHFNGQEASEEEITKSTVDSGAVGSGEEHEEVAGRVS
jgi:hypothetical protein